MNLDDIQRKLSNGFMPFIIRTADGREFPVPHKEFIMVTRRSVVVADEPGFVDILSPEHITSLREISPLPTRS